MKEIYTTEIQLVNDIIKFLLYKGHWVWRNNSGAARFDKRFVRFGKEGSPDIIGVQKGTGRFIAIECKLKGNKPTEMQEMFLEELRERGALVIVAYDLSDVEKII